MSQLSQFYINTGGNGVESVQAGTGISVDNTDPKNPVVTNEGVLSVVAGAGVSVDNTDPKNPVVENTGVLSVVAGSNITVNNADPHNPIASVTFTDSLMVTLGTGGTYTTLNALITALKGRLGDSLTISLNSNILGDYRGELTGFRKVTISLKGKTWTGNLENCDVSAGISSTFGGTVKNARVLTSPGIILTLSANTRVLNCELADSVSLVSGGANVEIIGCWCNGSSATLGNNVVGAALTVRNCDFSSVTTTSIQTPYGIATSTVNIENCIFGNVSTYNTYINCIGGYTTMGDIVASRNISWPVGTSVITLTRGGISIKQINALVYAAPYAINAISGVAQLIGATNVSAPCNWAAGVVQSTGVYFGV